MRRRRSTGITRGTWGVPHAAYDFGSFSMLARDLVGWDVLDGYDEVILANDSCYLLRPLDDVFARMDDARLRLVEPAGDLDGARESYDGDDEPMPLAVAKERFIGPRKWTDVRYLHLSSYFLVFRRPVVSDPGFRFRLDTVSGQRDKMLVVHKYEVGISRYLMDAGFDFDTFIPDLYAFHPLYSDQAFELIERGFPLIKRNFLGENSMHVLDLDAWPERLLRGRPRRARRDDRGEHRPGLSRRPTARGVRRTPGRPGRADRPAAIRVGRRAAQARRRVAQLRALVGLPRQPRDRPARPRPAGRVRAGAPRPEHPQGRADRLARPRRRPGGGERHRAAG